MTNVSNDARGQKTRINYQLIRNVTSPEEKKNGIQTFIANVPAEEIVGVGTEDNLRTYIPAHANKKRNSVHKAIENTIFTEPDRFINRNSGVTITCSSIHVDDKNNKVAMSGASIINGAQTQGEVRRFLESFSEEDDEYWPDAGFNVRVEINVDPVHNSVVETAIARNTATGVQNISQAGARGHLDELGTVIQKKFGLAIRKSETDTDVVETFQILQFARLLMPELVSRESTVSGMLKPYKQKAKCLEDFSDWFMKKGSDEESAEKYDFVIQVAALAIREYGYWEKHEAWNGMRIWEDTKKGGRACRRDKNGKVVWVSPGLLFPLMNSLSAFIEKSENGRWELNKPKQFKPEELIKRTVAQFRAHDSNPMDMGRSEGAYEALLTYPQTIADVIRDFEIS